MMNNFNNCSLYFSCLVFSFDHPVPVNVLHKVSFPIKFLIQQRSSIHLLKSCVETSSTPCSEVKCILAHYHIYSFNNDQADWDFYTPSEHVKFLCLRLFQMKHAVRQLLFWHSPFSFFIQRFDPGFVMWLGGFMVSMVAHAHQQQ